MHMIVEATFAKDKEGKAFKNKIYYLFPKGNESGNKIIWDNGTKKLLNRLILEFEETSSIVTINISR